MKTSSTGAGVIYTIGYQRFRSPAELRAKLDELSIELLIDVRSVPMSRKPGFGRNGLAQAFGERYLWRGNLLGGRPPGVLAEGIAEIRRIARKHSLALMCVEHHPADCHRHRTICGPHFRSAIHIVGDDVGDDFFTARDLDRAIAEEMR